MKTWLLVRQAWDDNGGEDQALIGNNNHPPPTHTHLINHKNMVFIECTSGQQVGKKLAPGKSNKR